MENRGDAVRFFAQSSFTTRRSETGRTYMHNHSDTANYQNPSSKRKKQKVGTKFDEDRTEDFPNSQVGGLTEDQCRQKSIETNSINGCPTQQFTQRQNIFFKFSYFHSLFDLIVDYTRITLVNESPARGSMVFEGLRILAYIRITLR